MLNIVEVNNQELTVYTCPQGKKTFAYIDIFCDNADRNANVVVKVNNVIYYSGLVNEFVSMKFVLTSGDEIKVFANKKVNVFVNGVEV